MPTSALDWTRSCGGIRLRTGSDCSVARDCRAAKFAACRRHWRIRNFGRGKKPGEPGYPRTVFLVHGDPEAQLAIAPKVEALGYRVHIPRWREQVELGVRDGP